MNALALEGKRSVARRKQKMNGIMVAEVILVILIVLGWIGIHIRPSPFAPVNQAEVAPETMAIPEGLPAPVDRFFRTRFGDQVPIMHSAVISGRGTMRLPQLFNLTLPVRFRFIHEAGLNYRHYIEVTFLGLPVLKVNEYYVDGKERQELPWAVATDNPKLDQGGNLGMWAEVIEWLPSVLVTDERVRWEPLDEQSAILVVPFGDEEERFIVRFSERTGEITYWEVMRYADGSGEKKLWVNGTWFDDGRPWFIFEESDVIFNVAVDTSLSAKGP